jgi:hypothetical protein
LDSLLIQLHSLPFHLRYYQVLRSLVNWSIGLLVY